MPTSTISICARLAVTSNTLVLLVICHSVNASSLGSDYILCGSESFNSWCSCNTIVVNYALNGGMLKHGSMSSFDRRNGGALSDMCQNFKSLSIKRIICGDALYTSRSDKRGQSSSPLHRKSAGAMVGVIFFTWTERISLSP